ncbi:MAG: taurine catabolism dioxygenase TauD, TfdA family protein [Rhodospirillales bacterium]|nr:taurine catabolism dioxygenase TauD, TfdA family protein [Rhodospirillales bacterium]
MHAAADAQQRVLPFVIEPASVATLPDFAVANRALLEAQLLQHGALLLRGFDADQDSFAEFVDALGADRLDYVYRSTPRTSVGDRVFTATIYPADLEIPLHCENAYQRDWPTRLAFHCAIAAASGGATPLADMLRVTERIGADRMARFAARGVRYVRNYAPNVDLPWQTVFQTDDRAEVDAYCTAHAIDARWDGDRLQTSQACQATARHPVSGREIWFNQAHLFHVSSLGDEQARAMLDLFGESSLPRHAVHADGGAIDADDLAAIRAAFAAEIQRFTWQRGDVLLLDNMQVAHGRDSFTGKRLILAAMSAPYSEVAAHG